MIEMLSEAVLVSLENKERNTMEHSFVNFKNQACLVTGAGSETGIGFNTFALDAAVLRPFRKDGIVK